MSVKKASKKSKIKRVPVSTQKPAPKIAPKAIVSTQVEPVVSVSRPVQKFWGVVAFVVLVAVSTLLIVGHHNDKPAVVQTSEGEISSPSLLKVVPGEEGSTSSGEASGALQPQATGLQQAQSAQSIGGPSLQAQETPKMNF